ncbi:hypothetical protein ACETK8_19335 [Brevundimonas staleyi]|uniref:Uncharacterized protein n=1 Tax=Brevundimonas staleyi TaxID=74326 RepID=A0ABW0FUP0_9CAUL
MHLPFLIPRVDFLGSDGTLEALHPGGALGRLRRPVLLLARDLCAFQIFDSAALPRSRRRQAARLHAKLASPYLVGGAALVKAGGDFGIWWWDIDRLPQAVSDRFGGVLPAIRPETLAQPAANGWRVVRLRFGYEAQLWSQGALVASAWRRDRFDGPAWRAFTSLQRGVDAPDEPPTSQSLPVDYDGEAFSLARAEISRNQAIGAAAGGFAVAACAAAMFLLGQGIQLRDDAGRIGVEAAKMRADTPRAGVLQALEIDRRRLADYQRLEEATNPISAAGAAIGIVAYHDITPTAVEAGQDAITLTLPYAAVAIADQLIEEFEGSGYFYDVRPRTEPTSQSLIVEMKVREAAPPLSAAG